MPRTIRLATLAIAALLASTSSILAAQAYWVSVVEDGLYRVEYEDLAAVAAPGEVDSALLALRHGGQPVPIWINDGADGSFGPGDSFEFIGEHLEGDTSFYSEHSHHNPYRLTLDTPGGRRMTDGGNLETESLPSAPLSVNDHLEVDEVMVRFGQRPTDPDTEVWFWRRLSFLDEEPFESSLDAPGLAPGTSHLRVQMRGWSRHRLPSGTEIRQHRAEVAINGVPVAGGDWDGQDFVTIAGEIPPGTLKENGNRVTVTVPRRLLEEGADPMVDLSLVNWVEFDYPHAGTISESQTELVAGGSGPRAVVLRASAARSLVVYDDHGRRWTGEVDDAGVIELRARVDDDASTLLAVRDGAFRAPAGVAVDRPSDWRAAENRADYLMIAHASLLEGTRRLAEYHRSRGLEVAVVDVQDVYDEFNHGIVHPRAIRDFVANAYRSWAPPAPRFVLLVGDSSWDVDRKESDDENYADWSYQEREATRAGFLKNLSTPYAAGPDNRGLVPTGSYNGAEGHAASDNYFAALDEGHFEPVLAVGRLPVVDPAELDAIVDKTIRYIEESGVGPWRRKLLWISNEEEYIQRSTDRLAGEQVDRGFSGDKVYPRKSEKSNEQHQQRLLRAFAEGQLLVHFHGHGGRYIWRTGPTDYKKNRDLFNLDHLDQLEPSPRLPMVLSMTCFSAPFDHPSADSIGEKFLRLPDRGAIAVLAASWRNSPAASFSRALVEELTKPQTIGEAVLRAKLAAPRRDMIETYNLLGDPAVPIAAPQNEIEIEVTPAAAGELRLAARLPGADSEFEGRAIIEWLTADGETVASEEVDVRGAALEATLANGNEAQSVSVYIWDAENGIDGLGHLDWAPEEQEPDPPALAGSASH